MKTENKSRVVTGKVVRYVLHSHERVDLLTKRISMSRWNEDSIPGRHKTSGHGQQRKERKYSIDQEKAQDFKAGKVP